MRVVVLTALLICSVLRTAHASDVEVLVRRLKEIAEPPVSMGRWTPAAVFFPAFFFTKEELHVADALRSIGSEAIPHLLPLLVDENVAIQDLAYFTLSEVDGWEEEHLDGLIKAYRGGDDWIPLAIAKIGSPRAANFLVEQLVLRRESFTQLTAAVANVGKNVVPPLLRLYHTELNWDADLEGVIYHTFHDLNDNASDAVGPLLKLAADEGQAEAKRFRAVKALGAIGPTALVPFLNTGNRFLSAVPAPEHAGGRYTSMRLLDSIAALRERGAGAGPLALKLLASEDWEVRVEAARALGRIGYDQASDQLSGVLQRPDDWRLVFCAAESLGMLKSRKAITALKELAERHWYPPVRTVALESITAIRSGTGREPKKRFGAFDFFDGPPGEDGDFLPEEDAGKLKLPVLPPAPQIAMMIKGEDGGVQTEKRTGIEVDGGYLVGADHGEFGGSISFIDEGGNSHVVADENTQEIYKTAEGVMSVGGLAHMGANSGFIFKLRKAGDQRWTAEKWRALPGAPRFSRLLKNGDLFVSCHGGIVVVSPAGEMKALTRDECLGSVR
jgi:HEAT repeat protein